MKNNEEYDEFNIVKYIHNNINNSMKYALDLGTMLSDDPKKLRAFKEQIKKHSRQQWEAIGKALVYLDLAYECICSPGQYCTACSGARYVMSTLIDSDHWVEEGMVIGKVSKDVEDVVRRNLFLAVNREVS